MDEFENCDTPDFMVRGLSLGCMKKKGHRGLHLNHTAQLLAPNGNHQFAGIEWGSLDELAQYNADRQVKLSG